ncbi:MAG: glutathione S-transferase [Ideonella sp.]|nr:glutathione S-transferase [Ideonella sp.]
MSTDPSTLAAVTDLPLLYTYRRCPYAMRARMALLWAQRPFAAFEIALRDKPAAMLAASPKGTVPVLCLPHGAVLEQSWDIMAWALQGSAQEDAWQRAQGPEMLALLQRNDGAFKRLLDAYKYPERQAPAAPREQARNEALAQHLLPLEALLQHHPHLTGTTPCATDLALWPFVRQFAAVDPAWFQALALPAVQAWLQRGVSSRLFAVCMTKLPAHTALVFPDLPPQPFDTV